MAVALAGALPQTPPLTAADPRGTMASSASLGCCAVCGTWNIPRGVPVGFLLQLNP